MSMDDAFSERWLRQFAASVAATREELTALDQEVGDGDFGNNLSAGLARTVRSLDEGEPGPAEGAAAHVVASARPLRYAADAFLDHVGGTSGPLFGLLFQELAFALTESEDARSAAALAEGTTEGLRAIQRVGEAEPGDKTLVDALAPAAKALEEAARADTEASAALAGAADAAWRGVRDTTRLRSRRGRASYVGERSTNVPDPGAVGIAVFFASAGGVVEAVAPFLAETEGGSGTG
ncbi:dihydroxyacetone kinase subunit DhaL [Streptomyces sp. NPDC007088]|uniref:dihydroxyacetone kinase subunit DhaL n=1 Tax=Streptomyces sp. NPDC007088 TaxID=3364773 RepID=UPI0036912B4E